MSIMRTATAQAARKRGGAAPAKRAGPAAAPEEESTRDRLLTVAERLFAERGFNGVSVRALTAAAGVNLASVGYHFESKEGLIAAIFERRCRPMMQERERLLALCAEGPGRPPLLEQIIAAFVLPAMSQATDAGGGGAIFTRLRAVLRHENSALARRLIAGNFDETSARFVDALHRCLPQLGRDAIHWRFHFLLSALYYTTIDPGRIRHISGGRCDPADTETAVRELVRFVAAGFRA